MSQSQTGDLLNYLTKELSEIDNELMQNNKARRGDEPAFAYTYNYQHFVDDSVHRITTYDNDLPPYLRDLILQKIKEFFVDRELNVEFALMSNVKR